MSPVEPAKTPIRFPDPRSSGRRGIVAVGEDFRPGTLLSAYRAGIFPWPHDGEGDEKVVAWFSPHRRATLPLGALQWSRSLRRTLRRHGFRISVNTAFREVMEACGSVREEGTWIIPNLVEGYVALHELGWAHSLEIWEGTELVGGIYGIAIGRAFSAESMFHRRTDASKIAFATLTERLRDGGYSLFDAQVMNPHIESLGCRPVARDTFLSELAVAQATEPPLPISAWP